MEDKESLNIPIDHYTSESISEIDTNERSKQNNGLESRQHELISDSSNIPSPVKIPNHESTSNSRDLEFVVDNLDTEQSAQKPVTQQNHLANSIQAAKGSLSPNNVLGNYDKTP